MNKIFNQKILTKTLKEFEEIAFAYVFGSSQNGLISEDSDLDIAIYFAKNEHHIDTRLKIIKALEKTISGFDNFDLVILNTASSILSMQAIQGTLLFVKDEYLDIYSGFYSLTCRQFEDENYWMKKQLEYRGYEVQWDN
jgi:predicted nucleotidyltransferase